MSDQDSVIDAETRQKHLKVDDTSHGTIKLVKGTHVYHKNPVGPNYVYKKKRGIITEFVNTTKKRAIVKWSSGPLQKHNVSSLVSLPPEYANKTVKKRKRVDDGPNSHVGRQSSLDNYEHRFLEPVANLLSPHASLQSELYRVQIKSSKDLIDVKEELNAELDADADSDSDSGSESESEWMDKLLIEINSDSI
jgi:hypothetical protein